VSGDDMGEGVLQKTYKHVMKKIEQYMSGTTKTIQMLFQMLFTNCVTSDKYITNIPHEASWNPAGVETVH